MQPDSRLPLFEDVYEDYEFAPLVSLALAAAAFIKRRLDGRSPHAQPVHGARPLPH